MGRGWVLLLWACFALVVYACGDDSIYDNARDASADSPTAPTTGGQAPSLIDAGSTDAGPPDNYVPEAGLITALVTDDSGPVMGTEVYFTDVDGTVTMLLTDAAGKASHSMFPGSSLTTNYVQTTTNANGAAGSHYLTTVAELTPGDIIHVGGSSPATAVLVGQITGTIDNPPMLDAGAVTYALEPKCGGWNIVPGPFPQAYTFNVDSTCVEAATGLVPILAVAHGANNSVLAVAPLVVANPDGGATVANVAAGDWVVPATKSVTFASKEPAADVGTVVDTPRNGQRYLQADLRYSGSLYVTAPPAFASVVEAHTDVSEYIYPSGPAPWLARASHYQRLPIATALAEDWTQLHLPDVSTAGTFTVSWSSDGSVVDGFATVPLLRFYTPDGGPSSVAHWQVVFPVRATKTSFTVPVLPAGLVAELPPAAWVWDEMTLGTSAQTPYRLARQYPTLLASPEQLASLVPGTTPFDLRTAFVQYSHYVISPVHRP